MSLDKIRQEALARFEAIKKDHEARTYQSPELIKIQEEMLLLCRGEDPDARCFIVSEGAFEKINEYARRVAGRKEKYPLAITKFMTFDVFVDKALRGDGVRIIPRAKAELKVSGL